MNHEATYASGERLAIIVHRLHITGRPWLLSDIRADLGVCPRTVQRYARLLVGARIVERCGVGGEPAIRIRRT